MPRKNRKTTTSKNNMLWFRKVRGSYLPVSWQGALLYIPYIFYIVDATVLTLDMDVIGIAKAYFIILQAVFATTLLTLVAQRTSR